MDLLHYTNNRSTDRVTIPCKIMDLHTHSFFFVPIFFTCFLLLSADLKKIQQHTDRALLYAQLVQSQQEELEKKRKRKQLRYERYQLIVKTAIQVQCFTRVYLARCLIQRIILHNHTKAAVRIQMLAKQKLVRNKCRARKRLGIETAAVLHIQFGWNKRVQRKEAKEELYRRKENRSRAKRRLLRDMDKERRLTAARMIQSMVRGWKGRKLIKLMEMNKRRRGRKKANRTSSRTVTPPSSSKKKKKKKGVVGPSVLPTMQ